MEFGSVVFVSVDITITPKQKRAPGAPSDVERAILFYEALFGTRPEQPWEVFATHEDLDEHGGGGLAVAEQEACGCGATGCGCAAKGAESVCCA